MGQPPVPTTESRGRDEKQPQKQSKYLVSSSGGSVSFVPKSAQSKVCSDADEKAEEGDDSNSLDDLIESEMQKFNDSDSPDDISLTDEKSLNNDADIDKGGNDTDESDFENVINIENDHVGTENNCNKRKIGQCGVTFSAVSLYFPLFYAVLLLLK